MKKTLSLIISMIMIIAVIAPMSTASAAEVDPLAWLEAQPDGTIVYMPNFNGEPGVYEPGFLSGDPVVTVDATNPNTMTMTSGTDKSKSYWGGFIETLPLNERTCYTIYFTATRSTKSAIGIYPDSVYGMYGYPTHTKLMNKGSSLIGHDYLYYETLGVDVPTLVEGSICVQEFALEVNGVDTSLAYYIKTNAGEWYKMDQSQEGEIEFFNADVLGLFFYVYYSDQVTTVSDCYVVKGLSFGEVVYPDPTTAPEPTEAPEVTDAPETTEEEKTDAPEATDAPDAPESTKVAPVVDIRPEQTEAPAEKKGCASLISLPALIILAAAMPVIARKKRK